MLIVVQAVGVAQRNSVRAAVAMQCCAVAVVLLLQGAVVRAAGSSSGGSSMWCAVVQGWLQYRQCGRAVVQGCEAGKESVCSCSTECKLQCRCRQDGCRLVLQSSVS